MDDHFYRDRARVLKELAREADPFIRKRLLRLANNYDDLAQGTRNTWSSDKEVSAKSKVGCFDGKEDVYS